MPRMQKFILKAFLAITSGLSTQTLAEDGVPFETAKAIGRRVAWTASSSSVEKSGTLNSSGTSCMCWTSRTSSRA